MRSADRIMKAEPSIQTTDLVIPTHVAIIMDGNGRWAKARGLPRIAGHKRGADAVRVAIESAVKYGVRYLTLYSFSSENWKRPADEVSDLMGLLRRYLIKNHRFRHGILRAPYTSYYYDSFGFKPIEPEASRITGTMFAAG